MPFFESQFHFSEQYIRAIRRVPSQAHGAALLGTYFSIGDGPIHRVERYVVDDGGIETYTCRDDNGNTTVFNQAKLLALIGAEQFREVVYDLVPFDKLRFDLMRASEQAMCYCLNTITLLREKGSDTTQIEAERKHLDALLDAWTDAERDSGDLGYFDCMRVLDYLQEMDKAIRAFAAHEGVALAVMKANGVEDRDVQRSADFLVRIAAFLDGSRKADVVPHIADLAQQELDRKEIALDA